MDRRTVLKGFGALALLPLLPARLAYTKPTLTPIPDDGEWHQFAIVREADDFKFYVDGELVAENMIIEPQWNRGQIWSDLSDGLRKWPDANVSSIWAKEKHFNEEVAPGLRLNQTYETDRSDFTLV